VPACWFTSEEEPMAPCELSLGTLLVDPDDEE
jgi:hypothetical protein